jgi:hypothetical protein
MIVQKLRNFFEVKIFPMILFSFGACYALDFHLLRKFEFWVGRYTGLTLAKWSITIMIGILVGDCLSLSLSPFDKKNYLRAVFPYY